MLTKADGMRAGMLLLIPDNFKQIMWEEEENTPITRFLKWYQVDPEDTFANNFSWDACTKLFRQNGIKITEDCFEEFNDDYEHFEFFNTMFATMLSPPVAKGLDQWM